ncbi:hypothetical protein RRG08_029163 [Elysia crispata]|uniref:Uncharacterized protein n=1 Tax=Elysia crispata TaxID=231223 RepID=A0AAE1AJ12_9GAST|nr:hypothetical protein RRG08_029163 [Elysia crispata]
MRTTSDEDDMRQRNSMEDGQRTKHYIQEELRREKSALQVTILTEFGLPPGESVVFPLTPNRDKSQS